MSADKKEDKDIKKAPKAKAPSKAPAKKVAATSKATAKATMAKPKATKKTSVSKAKAEPKPKAAKTAAPKKAVAAKPETKPKAALKPKVVKTTGQKTIGQKTFGKIKVTLRKSGIGYPQRQKDTIRGLGLRKLNSSKVLNDTPAIRGMVKKVEHLVTLEVV